MPTNPVTYGYARVSKADDEARNLDTQLRLLDEYGVRPNWSSETWPVGAPWPAPAGRT